MRLIYQNSSSQYETFLIEILEKSGHEVHLMDNTKLIDYFQTYCETPDEEGRESSSCAIITIDDCKTLHTIIQILSRPFNYRRPRVILISSLFTWAGGKHDRKIAGSWEDFKSRVPVIGAAEEYILENGFYDMVMSTGADACIVGLGLVYGGPAFDMEDIFQQIWSGNNTSISVLSTSDGNSNLPMIHCEDLGRLLCQLVEGGCTTPSGPIVFVPATDLSESSMKDTLTAVSMKAKTEISFTTATQAMDILLLQTEKMIWACDFPVFNGSVYSNIGFSIKFRSGLSVEFTTIWEEYLRAHGLTPCTVIVAGPPRTQKTQLAIAIAKKLGIQYIDVPSCVRYVMMALEPAENTNEDSKDRKAHDIPKKTRRGSKVGKEKIELDEETEKEKPVVEPPSTPDHLKALPTEFLKATKQRIEKALEGNGHGKGKKKKVEDSEDSNPYPDALCRALPTQVIRQCISATIRSDLLCLRRGYVLDCWDWAIQGVKDLQQVVGDKDRDDFQPIVESVSGDSSRPGTGRAIRYAMPELLFEIQTSDAVVMNRLQCQLLGIPLGSPIPAKLPKEHAGLVKDVETRQTSYSAHVEPVGEASEDAPPSMSHTGVKELEKMGAMEIFRVDTAETSLEDLVSRTREFFYQKHGGVGWLDGKPTTVSCDVNLAPDSPLAQEFISGMRLDSPLADRVMSGLLSPLSPDPLNKPNTNHTYHSAKLDRMSSKFDRRTHSRPSTAEKDASPVEKPKPRTVKTSLDVINENISKLDAKDQDSILAHCGQFQEYLVTQVLSHVGEGLIHITKEKPGDPIGFLASFLLTRGGELEKDATAVALEKFQENLRLADELDKEDVGQD